MPTVFRGPRADLTRAAVLSRLSGSPSTRAELARTLDVSPAVISGVVRELLSDRVIVETGERVTSSGRPARQLAVATETGVAIGIKVAPDHIALVDVSPSGEVLRTQSRAFDPAAPTFLVALARTIAEYLAEGAGRYLGVGVAVPGVVNGQSSGVVDSYQLGWSQVPLGETLQRELQLPVLVDNNVNALALAQQLYGAARAFESFLVVTIGSGIGAASVFEGAVHRGAFGGAGELGHIPFGEGGGRCSCGNNGCLETWIGGGALLGRAVESGLMTDSSDMDAMIARAFDGDTRVQALFAAAGRDLGRVLAGIVHMMEPEAIVLTGEGVSAWTHWELGFEPAFRGALLPALRGIPIIIEHWSDEHWAQGAASLLLATPFDRADIAGEQGRAIRSRISRPSVRRGEPGGR